MMFFKKKIGLALLALVVILAGYFAVPARAVDITTLQNQIKEYEDKIATLQGQANTLKNQISQFDAQIYLTQLKIQETEEKINLLGGRIDQLAVSLDALNTAFDTRVAETYKMGRLGDPVILLLSSPNLSQAVTRYNYLQRIQEADRGLLERLKGAKDVYQGEKTDQETLQAELEDQQTNLASQKAAKANLLSATQSDEKKYQSLLSEARAQLAAFSRFVTGQGGATILANQTKCDSWGCYYNQRDGQWGNIGLGGSSYSTAAYGCLVTSVAMLASHNGINLRPGDIASNPDYFVPGTGYLYWSAAGMPFTLSSDSRSTLDSHLASGPVIAGLYGGPDHFIVILRKEGDDYIMHDPFMPDGGNRKLSEQYSVSDITTLRLVSF